MKATIKKTTTRPPSSQPSRFDPGYTRLTHALRRLSYKDLVRVASKQGLDTTFRDKRSGEVKFLKATTIRVRLLAPCRLLPAKRAELRSAMAEVRSDPLRFTDQTASDGAPVSPTTPQTEMTALVHRHVEEALDARRNPAKDAKLMKAIRESAAATTIETLQNEHFAEGVHDLVAKLVADLIKKHRPVEVVVKDEAGKTLRRTKIKKRKDDDWHRPDREADFVLQRVLAGKHVLLVGPAGTGKSLLAQRVCEEAGLQPLELTLDESSHRDDLIGRDVIREGKKGPITDCQDGVVVRAMREGRPIILNELNATKASVLFALYRPLERLPVTMPGTGEAVTAKAGFCILATTNHLGFFDSGDEMYVDVQPMNEAFRDRFDCVVDVWYLPEEAEIEVARKKSRLAEQQVRCVVQTANLAREAMRTRDLACSFSTRKVVSLCEAIKAGTPLSQAYNWCVLQKAGRADRERLIEFARRAFPEDMTADFHTLTRGERGEA